MLIAPFLPLHAVSGTKYTSASNHHICQKNSQTARARSWLARALERSPQAISDRHRGPIDRPDRLMRRARAPEPRAVPSLRLVATG